jgi:hypothetical protein
MLRIRVCSAVLVSRFTISRQKVLIFVKAVMILLLWGILSLSLSLAMGQSLVKSHGQLYLQFYRQAYTLQSRDSAIAIVIDKGIGV